MSGCGRQYCVGFGRRKRGMGASRDTPGDDSRPTRLERRSWARSQSVIVYLFALVLVILIPALVVSLVLLNRNNQAQEEVVRALTNATVQAMGQSVEREIEGMVTTLRVLSTSPALLENDFAQFHRRASVALKGSGAYLLALDRDFNQLLNTRVPFGTTLAPTSDPGSARQALESGTTVVSGLFFGQTAQRWVFNVLLPVPDSPTAAVLALTRDAANLTPALQSRQLPQGWHAALVDSGNLVIAATLDAGLGTGTVLPMRQTQQSTDEWRRERFGGDMVVTSEWRSRLSGWRVIAWAAVDTVERPLGDSLLWLAAWGVIIAGVAGGLAMVLAQRVGRSVRGLRRDAQRLGWGDPVMAKAYPVAEIAEVSRALAEASSQRQAAEREVHFLMRELAHRSKNQMTVISAMAKQTARGADSVASYVEAFERRIHGLSRSTDLLLAHGRAGVLLSELIDSHIAPFGPPDTGRVSLSGPTVRLNAQAAQILGMAAHELSTNAVKYGAFAGDSGSLSVRWSIVDDRLDLVWRETVPDGIATSERVGFGTTVVQNMVARSLGAQVERRCHGDGIEWHFVIPLSAIDPAHAPGPVAEPPPE
jgi:two-component sensor histidine kinase